MPKPVRHRIPDNHKLTLRYAKHFGLTLVPFYPKQKDRVFLLGGKRIRVQAGTDLELSQVPFVMTSEERRLGTSGLELPFSCTRCTDLR
jgi:hypothetical protein